MASLYDITKGEDVELYRILSRAGLDAEMAKLVIRQPELADAMVATLREQLAPTVPIGDKFAPYLLDMEAQLQRLQVFNRRFWNNQLTNEQFEAVARQIEYIDAEVGLRSQRIDDLQILYVDFGSPEQTVEMWWKAIAGTQPNAWRWDGLQTDAEHLRLAVCTKQYKPGIHRVRINLVANWETQHGRSVNDVRERNNAQTGQFLAHAEVLAAYGLHDELLQQMDGQNLPYADLAGYEATVPGGDPWTDCPSLDWAWFPRGVRLGAGWAGGVNRRWAAPVVWES